MVSLANELTGARVGHTETRQIFVALLLGESDEFGFNFRGDNDSAGIMMLADIGAHLLYERIFLGVRKILLGDVAGEKSGFARKQEKATDDSFFFGSQVEGDNSFAGIKMGF